jgi:hypothetical protein
MTLKQIHQSFPSEWVLVVDPEVDRHEEVIRGRVLFHSKDRDDVDRAALKFRPRNSAFLFTGSFEGDMTVIL